MGVSHSAAYVVYNVAILQTDFSELELFVEPATLPM